MKLTPSPFPPGAPVVAYLRDSGGDDQDLSTEQQHQAISRWCDEHRLTLLHVFADQAAPGSTVIGRKQFAEMISYFHSGGPAVGVLVWRSNRFGRNLDDVQFYQADLRRRGITIHSLTDSIPDGAAGRLVEFALAWKDQVFLEQLSEDVQRGLYHAVQTYGAMPGTPPRGFMRVPIDLGKRRDGSAHTLHRWEPDPVMVPLIQRAYQMRAEGCTLQQISQATGLYKANNCWSTFFSRKLYKGVLEFGTITIENYCTPIVSPELWDSVQRVSPQAKPARRIASPTLLSGIVHCQLCGSPMYCATIQGWLYYECQRRKRRHDCPARGIPGVALEKEVMDKITGQIITLQNLLEMQNYLRAEQQQTHQTIHARLADLTETINTAQRAITNLTAAIAARGHSPAILTALTEHENQLAAAQLEQTSLRAALIPVADHPPATLQQLSEAIKHALQTLPVLERRQLIESFVPRILAHRTDNAILGVIEYTSPLNAKFPLGDGGNFGYTSVPPRGHRVYPNFTINISIPIKPHKQPKQKHAT